MAMLAESKLNSYERLLKSQSIKGTWERNGEEKIVNKYKKD